MRVIITGNRNFSNYALIISVMDFLVTNRGWNITEVITGFDSRSDELALDWAKSKNIKATAFDSIDSTEHVKMTLIERVARIVDYASENVNGETGGLVLFDYGNGSTCDKVKRLALKNKLRIHDAKYGITSPWED